ncbi:MAG: SMP-30/gluconolactonase/LRE family protein [Caldilineaceae bacterium]
MSWQFELLLEPSSIEGPAWDGSGLVFTDINRSRILRYDAASGEINVFRTGTNRANGLMLDKQGQLYGWVNKVYPTVRADDALSGMRDGVTVICDHFEGKKFNSPNDLAIDEQGRIWFTDPRYGDNRNDMELDHESVFRADPQGDGSWSVTRVTYDTTSPNGLLISPDNKTLYVAQSKYGEGQKRELRAYPIHDDGSVGEHQVLHNFIPTAALMGCVSTRPVILWQQPVGK